MKEMNSLIAHRNEIEKMWFQTLELNIFLFFYKSSEMNHLLIQQNMRFIYCKKSLGRPCRVKLAPSNKKGCCMKGFSTTKNRIHETLADTSASFFAMFPLFQ